MTGEVKPIRSEADHEQALAEVEILWGAPSSSPESDRLDVLATLIDAYEAERYPAIKMVVIKEYHAVKAA